jgi:AbrB family looped-hinge helix DNA binding protein
VTRNGSPNTIINALFHSKATILSLDKAGRIIIPKAIREKLHLALQAEVIGDRIELTLLPPEIRLEKKGKRRVVVETGSFNAVEAVAEAREDHPARLEKSRSK